MQAITINGRKIGNEHPPFIIAELSANHNGSIERAFQTMNAAHLAGVDAVKIQTYTPDTITIDCDREDFIIRDGLWSGQKLYDLYKKAHTPFEWHKPLFDHAQKKGITLFSTPFDESAVDLLEELGVPAYKIASFELVDLPLIRYVARTGKPMIMSTGMASLDEISEALEAAKEEGCRDLALLHCVSSYPTSIEQAQLRQINTLRKEFQTIVGLSDHSMGALAAITSIALGASIVEKHFTLNRSHKGPDSEFSIEPDEMKTLCHETRMAWQSLGSETFVRPKSESTCHPLRRSIYFVRDMKAGEKIGPKDIKRIRPGFGLSPKYFETLIGKRLAVDVDFGTPTNWEMFKEKARHQT